MEFLERARIRMEHWISHNDHHQEDYSAFAAELERAEKTASAQYIREMIEINARCTECLKRALEALDQ
ncbi:MAG: hypothetical protein ACOWYE_15005 [Desulfatiglandales bacterium]